MWYGEEQLSFRQIGCFIVLAFMHLFILPVLMVSMETRPLQWFYKKYNLPLMKVFLQLISYLALLMAFSYMLVFNLSETISYTDYFIIGWMISFFLDETKQALVSVIRKRFKKYRSDCWNKLDWILILGFTTAVLLKFGADKYCLAASQILLVLIFIFLCIRVLNMFSWSEFVGPKLVMIRKMFKDTFGFMVIMTVIMISYNVSFHSLLYPNSDFSWSEIEKVMQNGYWTLFGENNVDSDALTEPDCTFNKTIYSSGELSRCPATIGLHIAPYLKAIYSLIAVTLLLNLLIAIYSDTFQQVQVQSKFHWSLLQKDFLEEYSLKTIFPIHLQLIALPVCLVHWLIWCICNRSKCCSNEEANNVQKANKLNTSPMFVRVFCYNTNYDQRLNSTELTEAFATLKSKGVIDVIKEDTITVLQEQMEIQNIMMANQDELKMQLEYQTQKFEEQQERNMRRNEMMLEQHLAEQRSMERVESMRREKVELRSISEKESTKEYEQMSRKSRDFENFMGKLMEEQIRRLYEMNERLDELHAFVKHTQYEQQAHSAQILEIMVQMQQKKDGTDKTQQTME
ncbi:transient receptor potential cation channel subfamily M member-like 2 [Mytilus californianus]|uniref:transient receptor potential cation channel subfamily M member-like 2 n=1 Tax=Mytilus californianus TaxID=6549 RepID=UPI00224737D5|nr:transient receptor potential cation channel subfamily M member-like 2 [Mytilus californianus]